MKAKAVYVVAEEKLDLLSHEVREPGLNEVTVKTKACGVCYGDAWLFRNVNPPGPMPFTFGHEGVGIVEKVGPGVNGFAVGDKVACASGCQEEMCEYFTVEADCLAKLPDDTEDWAAAVLEPACCAANVLYKANIETGDHVVLVGAGYMGLLALQGIMHGSPAGRVTVFEPSADRRKIAESYGKLEAFDPTAADGQKAIEAIIASGGADICIEFAGNDAGFKLADSMTKQAGKFVIAGFHPANVSFNGTKWHFGGLNVLNLAPMSNRYFREIIPRTQKLVERGVYDLGSFITHTARYDDIDALNELFKSSVSKSGNYMKGVIMFDS